jgi:hypothetical protein
MVKIMKWLKAMDGELINCAHIAKISSDGISVIAHLVNLSSDRDDLEEEVVLFEGAEFGDADNILEYYTKILEAMS